MIRWHKADLVNRMYCNIEGGKKISMPRYYKQKLYDENEAATIQGFQRILNALLLDELRKSETEHDRSERHLQEFRKMYHRSKEGRSNCLVN